MPGRQLAMLFYSEAVRPLLERRFPHVKHGAGLLGSGSDVLGFDTPQSMDHHWGLRLWLFLAEPTFTDELAADIDRVLGQELPFDVGGFPTHFADADIHGGHMEPSTRRPIRHMVLVTTVRRFCRWYLRAQPLEGPLSPAAWLALPEQRLRSVTTGVVYHDGTAELTRLQAALQWYPRDVWVYVLAAQWRRIEQEEAFMGRCAQVGDDLGSRVVAARLVRELMHLCCLMERQYAPYTKWFGSAFSRLACADRLLPVLIAALSAEGWRERERHLTQAYEVVATMHNQLGLTEPLAIEASPFYGRPFLVIHGDRFAEALTAAIEDPSVRALPGHIGSINQWIDSTDVLGYPDWYDRLRPLYEPPF